MATVTTGISLRGMDVLERLAAQEPLRLDTPAFYFLRHGQTEGNRTRIFQRPDIALNETGLAQARRAAQALADRPIRRILASDMERAWRTAHIVADALGLPVIREPGLRERFFGDLIGTSSLDLDWAKDPPNGETLTDFVTRIRAALARTLAHAETTLLVSHGGVLHVLIAALGVPARTEHTANAAPLLFERGGKGWRITALVPDADPALTGSLS